MLTPIETEVAVQITAGFVIAKHVEKNFRSLIAAMPIVTTAQKNVQKLVKANPLELGTKNTQVA